MPRAVVIALMALTVSSSGEQAAAAASRDAGPTAPAVAASSTAAAPIDPEPAAGAIASAGMLVDAPLLGLLVDAAGTADADDLSSTPALSRWLWPIDGAAVTRPYEAPATRYGAGHRGVDLGAAVGVIVAAPTAGVVVFAGRVVDRTVLTLDAGDGVILTVEPIATTLRPGDVVGRGDPLGVVDVGGHAEPGSLHLGVRVDGEYVDPMRFFGGVARAVLLPCC